MTKPWVSRRDLEEPIEMLEKGLEDWNELNWEERHGFVHEAHHMLEKVQDD